MLHQIHPGYAREHLCYEQQLVVNQPPTHLDVALQCCEVGTCFSVPNLDGFISRRGSYLGAIWRKLDAGHRQRMACGGMAIACGKLMVFLCVPDHVQTFNGALMFKATTRHFSVGAFGHCLPNAVE